MLLLDKKIYSNPRNGEKFLWNPQTPTMKFIEGKVWEYQEHAPYFSDDGSFMLPMTEISDFLRDYGYWGDLQLRYDTVKQKVYAWREKEWIAVPQLKVEDKNDVIYVAARSLLEFLGYEVVWDADLKNIQVYDRRLFPYEL